MNFSECPAGHITLFNHTRFADVSCNFFCLFFFVPFWPMQNTSQRIIRRALYWGSCGGGFVSSSITQPLPERMVHPRTRNFMDSHSNTYTARARGCRTRTWKRSSNFGTFRVVKSPENTRTEPSGVREPTIPSYTAGLGCDGSE